MKKDEKKKLSQENIKELNGKLTKIQAELVKKTHEIRLSKSKNTRAAKNLRYQIALIKTFIRQKQLEPKKGN